MILFFLKPLFIVMNRLVAPVIVNSRDLWLSEGHLESKW